MALRASQKVLRDFLPDVPRPILSRDEPPFLRVEERPVPRNIKISQDIVRKFGFTPGGAKCRKLSRNEYSQDCRTRIEAASRTDPVCRDRASEQNSERWISTQRKWKELIIQGEPHWNQVTCLDHQLERDIPRSDPEGEDHSSARDAKRARGEPGQDLSGESPFPSADETLTHPEIPAVPSISTLSSSSSSPISPGAPLSSGVKRPYSESTASPDSLGASSGSGVKRAHGDSIVNDDDE